MRRAAPAQAAQAAKAMLSTACAVTSLCAALAACQPQTPEHTPAALARRSAIQTNGANAATAPSAPPAAQGAGAGGTLDQLLQSLDRPRGVIAPGARPPYGRPDLSADAEERARAAAMQTALNNGKMEEAQRLVSTQALREMYTDGQRMHALTIVENQIAAQADREAGPGAER